MAKTIKKVFTEYLCEICDKELRTLEGFPCVMENNKTYCLECAVLNEIINAEEYVEMTGQKGFCFKGPTTLEGNKICFHDSLGRIAYTITVGDTWHD